MTSVSTLRQRVGSSVAASQFTPATLWRLVKAKRLSPLDHVGLKWSASAQQVGGAP